MDIASYYRILTKGESFEAKFHLGWPKKTSNWQNREILRLVLNQNLIARPVSKEETITASKSPVH